MQRLAMCWLVWRSNCGGGKKFLFSIPIQTKLGAYPASFKMATGFIYWWGRSWGLILTTHFHLAVRLRMSRLPHGMFCGALYFMSSQYCHNSSVLPGLVSSFLPSAFPQFSAEYTSNSSFTSTVSLLESSQPSKGNTELTCQSKSFSKALVSSNTLGKRLVSFLPTIRSTSEQGQHPPLNTKTFHALAYHYHSSLQILLTSVCVQYVIWFVSPSGKL